MIHDFWVKHPYLMRPCGFLLLFLWPLILTVFTLKEVTVGYFVALYRGYRGLFQVIKNGNRI